MRYMAFVGFLACITAAPLASRDALFYKERFSELHEEYGLAALEEECRDLSGEKACTLILDRMARLSDFSLPGVSRLADGTRMSQIETHRVIRHAIETFDPQDLTLDDATACLGPLRDCDRLEIALELLPRIAGFHLGVEGLRRLARAGASQGVDRVKILDAGLEIIDRRRWHIFEIVPYTEVIACTHHEFEFIQRQLPKIIGLDVEVVRLISREMRAAGTYDVEAYHFIEAGLEQLDHPPLSTRELSRLARTLCDTWATELIVDNLQYVTDLSADTLEEIVAVVDDDACKLKVRRAAAQR